MPRYQTNMFVFITLFFNKWGKKDAHTQSVTQIFEMCLALE